MDKPPARLRKHFHEDVREHDRHIACNKEYPPLPIKMKSIPRYPHHRCNQQEKQPHAAHKQRIPEFNRVRHPRLPDDEGARKPNTEEDVEHGPAETGAEAHNGCDSGDGDVGYKVGEGVAYCKDSETNDRVGEPEYEAECL